MYNKIFKAIIAICAITAVVIMYGIYQDLSASKYQMNANGYILNTKTGVIYYHDLYGYFYYKKGKRINLDKLP